MHYQVATSRTNMRRPYGSLLPLEGEAEDEGRSKATDSYSDLTPHLPPTQRYGGAGNPLPFVKGEAALPRLNNEEAVSI